MTVIRALWYGFVHFPPVSGVVPLYAGMGIVRENANFRENQVSLPRKKNCVREKKQKQRAK